MFRALADGLVAALLAPPCAACQTPLEHPLDGPVCRGCWAAGRLPRPPLCRTCGDTLPSWRTVCAQTDRCARCRRLTPAVDRARAAGIYDGELREIVHAFKYDRRRSLASPLARLIRAAGAELLDGADLAVAVPLHPWRRLRRGFNQSHELARRLDLPVAALLWRVRATRPQAGLTPHERRRNVRGAFRLSPLIVPRRVQAQVSGRTLLLVDDVRTTGATLDACARLLKEAGAREVRALTVAQAPRSEHPLR